MNHPRSLLRRAAGAAAALVVASAALLSAGSSPARADQNTDIKFGPVTLTHVTDKGEAIPAPGRQLYKGDWFYLNVDFDATKANPKPGQSFTIDLPEPFVNRDGGNSRGDVIKPLEYTDSQGATVKAGECKVDRSRITCTFGDAVEGKLDVSGKIQAQLLTNTATRTTGGVATPPAASPTPDPKDPATTGPVEPADPGADDPVDPAESAKATPQPQQTPPASTPRAVPAPIKPGLPGAGHNGCVRQDEKGSGSGESRP